jgi:hypothetical protein
VRAIAALVKAGWRWDQAAKLVRFVEKLEKGAG